MSLKVAAGLVILGLLLLLPLSAVPASAQDGLSARDALRPGPGLTASPSLAVGIPAIAHDPSPGETLKPLLQARSRGSVPLMAAGATLLIAGAIIGGDAGTLVMVGGAGVLAWGVYLHF